MTRFIYSAALAALLFSLGVPRTAEAGVFDALKNLWPGKKPPLTTTPTTVPAITPSQSAGKPSFLDKLFGKDKQPTKSPSGTGLSTPAKGFSITVEPEGKNTNLYRIEVKEFYTGKSVGVYEKPAVIDVPEGAYDLIINNYAEKPIFVSAKGNDRPRILVKWTSPDDYEIKALTELEFSDACEICSEASTATPVSEASEELCEDCPVDEAPPALNLPTGLQIEIDGVDRVDILDPQGNVVAVGGGQQFYELAPGEYQVNIDSRLTVPVEVIAGGTLVLSEGASASKPAQFIFSQEAASGPTARITSPKNGARFSQERAGPLLVTSKFDGFTDGATLEYTYFVGSTPVSNCDHRRSVFPGIVGSCEISKQFLQSLPAGDHILSVFARDVNGSVATGAARSEGVTISLTERGADQVGQSKRYEMSVSAIEGLQLKFKVLIEDLAASAVETINWYFDGRPIGTTEADKPFLFDTRPTPDGIHEIRADVYVKAEDGGAPLTLLPEAQAQASARYTGTARTSYTQQGNQHRLTGATPPSRQPATGTTGIPATPASQPAPTAAPQPSPGFPIQGKFSTVQGLIAGIINFMLLVGAILSLIALVVGGLQYVTSAGDVEKAGRGKTTVTYAVIGIIVVLSALAIVNFLFSSFGGPS